MVSCIAHSPLLFPNLQLLLDALRRRLSTHGTSFGIHNGKQAPEVHDRFGMGHTTHHYNHICSGETVSWNNEGKRGVSNFDISIISYVRLTYII